MSDDPPSPEEKEKEKEEEIEKEEEKMKQSKVYTFREFPYCFFSAKTLRNLLNF